MNALKLKYFVIAVLSILSISITLNSSYAGKPKQESALDRKMKEADRAYKQIKERQRVERMRDKRHDNRLKTGKNSSVGVGHRNGAPEVNFRITK